MRTVKWLTVLAMLVGSLGIAGPAVAAPDEAAKWNPGVNNLNVLYQWYHAGRTDHFLAGSSAGHNRAANAGYNVVGGGGQGYVLSTFQVGTNPLYSFWREAAQDHYTAASPEGVAHAFASGYVNVGVEGYVFASQVPGTVPLYQFWHGGRLDALATATAAGISQAYSEGYVLARIEGYVYPV